MSDELRHFGAAKPAGSTRTHDTVRLDVVDSHRSRTDARASRRPVALIAVLLCGAVLVGCGGDDTTTSPTVLAADDDSSSGDEADDNSSTGDERSTGDETDDFLEAARADVEAAREPIAELALPDEPPGPIPPGRRIAIVRAIAAPLPTRAADGAKVAVEAVGWQGDIIDGQGNPQGWQDAVNRAITGGADAIMTVAMPTTLIQPAIDRANDEGIPVIALLADMDVRTDPIPPGLANGVTSKGFEEGYRLGQWVVQDAPEGADVIVLNQPEVANLQRVSDGFKSAIADAGDDYAVVAEADSPLSDVQGPQGVQRMAALLRSNPDARYIMTLSETWFGGFQQAAKLEGGSDVTALGSDGDFAVPLIKEGAKLVMVGPDSLLYGWYAVDATIRAFNDRPQPTYDLQYQLVDSTNAGDVNGEGITATVDYATVWMDYWQAEQ